MLTGGLLVLAGCGGGTRVVTKTVTGTPPATVSKPTPPAGPSAASLAAAHAVDATAIGDNAMQAASPVGDAVFMTAAMAAAQTMSTATSTSSGRGRGAGAGASKSGPHRVASGQGTGQYAVVYTNGTFHHPSAIILDIAASPPQLGTVDWSIVCFELSGGIGRKQGRETLQLPITKTLPLPAPSSTCIGSANVQLSKTGTVSISISG
jgi:hypothetical protein